MSPLVEDFSDLEVYREAMEVSRWAFAMSKRFPVVERRTLTEQLLRASSSIGAQIAESWAKRRYPRHFIAKLSDADAEQLETRHWLAVAVDRGYVSTTEAEELVGRLDRIGRRLNVMMRKARQFAVR